MAVHVRSVLGKLGATNGNVYGRTADAQVVMTGGMADATTMGKSSTAVLVMGGSAVRARDIAPRSATGQVGMTGGMVGRLFVGGGVTYAKTTRAAMGSLNQPFTAKATEPAVTTLTGSMTRSMVYAETMSGDYPPLVWMDGLVDAPTFTLGGSMAKLLNGANTIVKTTSAAVEMGGAMSQVGRTHVKSTTAVLTLSTGGTPFASPAQQGARNLRSINRKGRRDRW